MLDEAAACFAGTNEDGNGIKPLPSFVASLRALRDALQPFLSTLGKDTAQAEVLHELDEALGNFSADAGLFQKGVDKERAAWKNQKTTNGALKKAVERIAPLAETSRDLVKQADLLYKLACRLIETCETECNARESESWQGREITRARKDADEARQGAVAQLKQVRYFHRQARWLTERFPEAKLRDVEGLVKLVDRAEIESNGWSLTPGRYVGVTPEEEDEDFDFEESLRDIHVELKDLNTEAVELAAQITKNFEELGI